MKRKAHRIMAMLMSFVLMTSECLQIPVYASEEALTDEIYAVDESDAEISENEEAGNILDEETIMVSSIDLSAYLKEIAVGNEAEIRATIEPFAAVLSQEIVWSSSDEKVAVVEDGLGLSRKIKAIGTGTATITVSSTDGSGISASCTVKVVDVNAPVEWNDTDEKWYEDYQYKIVENSIYLQGIKEDHTGNFRGNIVVPAKAVIEGIEYSVVIDTIGSIKHSTWYICASTITGLKLSEGVQIRKNNYFDLFYGMRNARCIDISQIDNSAVTSLSGTFSLCEDLSLLEFGNLKTDDVTDMSGIFSGCSNLEEIDLSKFVTSNVTDMGRMFNGCCALKNLDVSGFDTTKVTGMSSMFCDCSNLKEIDVSRFNTSNVTYMNSMFSGCENLKSLDVSGFDTSNVTTMSSMFAECEKLENIDVSGFDTTNVTTMGGMFYKCESLQKINLSGFNTSNVTSMGSMFGWCKNLSSIDVTNFDTSNVNEISYMFVDMDKLSNLDLRNMVFKSDCNTIGMIDRSAERVYLPVGWIQDFTINSSTLKKIYYAGTKEQWEALNNTIPAGVGIEYGYTGGIVITTPTPTPEPDEPTPTPEPDDPTPTPTPEPDEPTPTPSVEWKEPSAKWYESYNYEITDNDIHIYCSNGKGSYDVSGNIVIPAAATIDGKAYRTVLETGYTVSDNVVSIWYPDNDSITGIKISRGVKLGKYGCYALFCCQTKVKTIDISEMDLSDESDMTCMFAVCTELTDLRMGNIKTDKVWSMNNMFSSCRKLEGIDVSTFNTENVSDMRFMFYGAYGLKELDIRHFDIKKDCKTDEMVFNSAKVLYLPVEWVYGYSEYKDKNGVLEKIYYAGTEEQWTALNNSVPSDVMVICNSRLPGQVIKVSGISLTPSGATVKMGKKLSIKADVTPDDAADKSLSWISSDEETASVDQQGVVYAKKVGSVTITARANDGSNVSANCIINVISGQVEKAVDAGVIYIGGESINLRYNICYDEEIDYQGRKIKPYADLNVNSDLNTEISAHIIKAATGRSDYQAYGDLIRVTYTGKKNTNAGNSAYFTAKLKLNTSLAKSFGITGQNLKETKKAVKRINRVLKSTKFYFKINPLDLYEAYISSNARITAKGTGKVTWILVKVGNGSKKIKKSDFILFRTDVVKRQITIKGKRNFTGGVILQF